MNARIPLLATLLAFSALAAPLASRPADVPAASPADPLLETISALDHDVFDAFNNCSAPEQLQRHAEFFAPDVEFYHDTGGVTWTRADMLANTEKYVCGHFRRELVPGTLRVSPVKDFGAIALGTHRFCQFDTGKCDGIADFVMVWRRQDGVWQITRVLSFGHRSDGDAS